MRTSTKSPLKDNLPIKIPDDGSLEDSRRGLSGRLSLVVPWRTPARSSLENFKDEYCEDCS